MEATISQKRKAADGRRAIVCGSRALDNVNMVLATLSDMHKNDPFSMIIEGGADGVDRTAREWAKEMGIATARVDANWDKYGRGGGPIRNGWMLDLMPDIVIAFPGGRGTANMVMQARSRGVEVIEALR